MLTRTLLALFARLPLIASRFLGSLCGGLLFLLPTKKRRIASINLAYCLPDTPAHERRQILRKSLVHECQTILEIPALMHRYANRIDELVTETRGEHHLHEAIQQGNGVILAIPHLGNWEVIGLYCSKRHPMTSLYRPQHRNSQLDNYIRTGRERLGARLVPTDAGGVKALYRALSDNHIVAILPDQSPAPGSGVFAPLFGHPVGTMVLPNRLLRRTHATLLFCYAERLSGQPGYRLHFIPADEKITAKDPGTAASALNQGLEQCILHAPGQYWWSYKRFKSVPPDTKSPYD